MNRSAADKAAQHESVFSLGERASLATLSQEQRDAALNRMATLELSTSIDRLCTVLCNLMDKAEGI